MTDPHVIRIEAVRVDPLEARAEGVVVRREADGLVSRRRISIPGDPVWTTGQAEAALLARSGPF